MPITSTISPPQGGVRGKGFLRMARQAKSKGGSRSARRAELRRTLPKPTIDFGSMMRQPEFVSGAAVTQLFLVLVSWIVIWARERLKVDDGMIMTGTRLKRLDYTVSDEDRTDAARRRARERAPAVYTLDVDRLEALRKPFLNLPVIVAEQADFQSIDEQARIAYELDDQAPAGLAAYASAGSPSAQWVAYVSRLLDEVLPRYPLVPGKEWTAGMLQPELPLLRGPDGRALANWNGAVKIDDQLAPPERGAALVGSLLPVVHEAGFPRTVARYVAAGIASQLEPPTYELDQAATAALTEQRAAAVETILVEHHKGDVIYRRGDGLTARQRDDLSVEMAQFATAAPFAERWLPRLGIIGLTMLVAGFLAGYIAIFYPKIARNPLRLLAICLLMSAMLWLTAKIGIEAPSVLFLGAVAPTLFVAVLALLAYDQRIALFLSATQCALAAFVLEQGVGSYVMLFAGCGVAVAQLRDVRRRSTLPLASAFTGLTLAAAALLLGMVETPLVPGAWAQIGFRALMAGIGGLSVGFVVLGILPSLEKWFGMTTGMTLAELRDPRQPLLRQLQQRAPGTYNHSLQVANIAEAAAEAIKGDSLLVFVGALYHDIGKMNKPEYFVENQPDGASKHAKLSPAMSLLVIVGHVKDGIELAREYGLPKKIQHLIESHHGTTLVEYFYHAAKTQAESDDRSVQEIEFRYPGPKPRTREAAVLMVADAVESATRSLAEPTPSRIESLVRQLSRKRLMDGQYDHCDLTFRELETIEESMIKSLCAIYHGRITYPSQREEEDQRSVTPAQQTAAG